MGATAVWRSTFFLIRDLVQAVPAVDFLALRFVLSSALMLLLWHRQLLALTRRQFQAGLLLGGIYGLAQVGQTIGLAHTAASVSGFVTGLYVVLTPVLGAIILRERITRPVAIAVGLATAGLAIISLSGVSFGFGEVVTLSAAGLYALHILGLARVSRADVVIGMSVAQMLAITVVCLIGGAPSGYTLPTEPKQWAQVAYMVLFASIGALLVQTWAQSQLSATRAAIVMTTEPVFAAGFAVAFGGEVLTARLIIGGALVLAAMYAVELPAPPVIADEAEPPELLHHETG